MYEVTVIENLPHTIQMFHIALDDDVVDQEVKLIYENEQMAVHANQIIAFTIISEYQRYNSVEHYRRPNTIVGWKKEA